MNLSRLLGLVAVSGAVLSAGCFAGAYRLANANDNGSGEIVTREIPWDGSRAISLGVEADLRYVQTAGAARLTARGPERSVATLSIDAGHVRDALLHTGARLTLTLEAPDVAQFTLNGTSHLVIENYAQPALMVTSEGKSSVEASGRTQAVTVNLQGRAAANLARLEASELLGRVGGSATLIAAPRTESRLLVDNSGSVVMLTTPALVANTTEEAGRVFNAAR
jgi:hypothetical protein